jgi:hypothetical protein
VERVVRLAPVKPQQMATAAFRRQIKAVHLEFTIWDLPLTRTAAI